jgi:hypothetical protein
MTLRAIQNPNFEARRMLRPTKEYPNPRLAWDMNTVMPSDLTRKIPDEKKEIDYGCTNRSGDCDTTLDACVLP